MFTCNSLKYNLLQRMIRRRSKPKFFKSTSGSSSVEYSADVEDTGVTHNHTFFVVVFVIIVLLIISSIIIVIINIIIIIYCYCYFCYYYLVKGQPDSNLINA